MAFALFVFRFPPRVFTTRNEEEAQSSRRDGRLVRPRRAQLGSEIICLAKARKAQFKKLSRDCHAEEQSDEASLSAAKNANAPSKLRLGENFDPALESLLRPVIPSEAEGPCVLQP